MKILLVDDHTVVREGVRRLLSGMQGASIFEAANGHEALAIFRKERPELVLLDLNLSGIGGLELLRRLIMENKPLAPDVGQDGLIHYLVAEQVIGDAKATEGFDLAARWIIHTVGPVWRGGGEGEDEVLASCYRRSLEVADGLGAVSLAFPAISTGIYGFPKDLAAMIAVTTLRRTASAAQQVILVAFDEETLGMYETHLSGDG